MEIKKIWEFCIFSKFFGKFLEKLFKFSKFFAKFSKFFWTSWDFVRKFLIFRQIFQKSQQKKLYRQRKNRCGHFSEKFSKKNKKISFFTPGAYDILYFLKIFPKNLSKITKDFEKSPKKVLKNPQKLTFFLKLLNIRLRKNKFLAKIQKSYFRNYFLKLNFKILT